MSTEVEFELLATSDRFEAADDRWLRQLSGLLGELNSEGVRVTRRTSTVAGEKGGLDQLILTLGTAGVFTTVTQVISSWLNRDSTRRIRLKFYENGRLESIDLAGASDSSEIFQRISNLVGPGPPQ